MIASPSGSGKGSEVSIMPSNINPITTEHDYLNSIAEEAAIVRGLSCKLITLTRDDDIYDEGDITSFTSVDINAILDDNPNKKLLKNLNWLPEDDEDLPTIAMIPRTKDTNQLLVCKGQLIKFHDRVVVITDVRMSYILGSWYVTKCIPYEENREESINTSGNKHENSFIVEED